MRSSPQLRRQPLPVSTTPATSVCRASHCGDRCVVGAVESSFHLAQDDDARQRPASGDLDAAHRAAQLRTDELGNRLDRRVDALRQRAGNGRRNQVVAGGGIEADAAGLGAQADAAAVAELVRRRDDRQHRHVGQAADAPQLLAQILLLRLQLGSVGEVLPRAAAAARQIRTRRHAALRRAAQHRVQVGVGERAAVLAHRDLDLLARHDAAHEDHLAVEPSDAVWTVGEAGDRERVHCLSVAHRDMLERICGRSVLQPRRFRTRSWPREAHVARVPTATATSQATWSPDSVYRCSMRVRGRRWGICWPPKRWGMAAPSWASILRSGCCGAHVTSIVPARFACGGLWGCEARRKVSWSVQRRQCGDQLLRFEAYRDDAAHELHDVIRLVCAVRVVGDTAAGVGAHLVLINHPFERGAVAEPV